MASEPAAVKHGRGEKLAIAAIWVALVGPLLAVFVQQQVGYALVDSACGKSGGLIQAAVLAGLVGAVVTTGIGWRQPRRHRASSATENGPVDREFFLTVSLSVSLFVAAVVLALWLPTLFLDPCRP
jgi:hypothetical protein